MYNPLANSAEWIVSAVQSNLWLLSWFLFYHKYFQRFLLSISKLAQSFDCTKSRNFFNPIQTGLFWTFSDRGGGGKPPYLTFRIIKQSKWNFWDVLYVRKSFFWYTSRGMVTSHYVTITSWCQNSRHLGSAILDFRSFPKCKKTAQNYCKVLKNR